MSEAKLYFRTNFVNVNQCLCTVMCLGNEGYLACPWANIDLLIDFILVVFKEKLLYAVEPKLIVM